MEKRGLNRIRNQSGEDKQVEKIGKGGKITEKTRKG